MGGSFTMRLRALLVAAALLATGLSPVHAAGPLVLVSARGNGGLALVKVYGYNAVYESLVDVDPHKDGRPLYPRVANAQTVSYVADGCCGSPITVGLVDTEEKRLLPLANDALELLVSPDGRTRYLTTFVRDGQERFRDAIVRTDASGRSRRTLFSVADEEAEGMSQPALSPDGRTIYVGTSDYHSLLSMTFSLWAMDTVTGARRLISIGTNEDMVASVAVSPDGRLLAVTTYAFAAKPRVRIVPLDGGIVTELRSLPDSIYAPAFTPDSRHVVVSFWNEGGLGLADVTTGVVVRIHGAERFYDAVPLP